MFDLQLVESGLFCPHPLAVLKKYQEKKEEVEQQQTVIDLQEV